MAVYVHTPFCPSKCGYCDFNSFAMDGPIVGRTVDAIEREILATPWAGRPAKTIFFGGGTPTFLSSDQLGRLLRAVLAVHPPASDIEITSEANPGTVDLGKFEGMRQAGFNRLSLGAQSFQPEDLVRLGRVHRAGEVGRAVTAARQAGFTRLNVDLMFGLPGQRLAGWTANLDLALALRPDHLSLYGLTIETNTRFDRLSRRGMLDLPDEDVQRAMYEHAVERTAAAGLDLYEISNFAQPGQECQHNLAYWRAEEYLGYGPGAVGCVADLAHGVRERATNLKHPERYCDGVDRGLAQGLTLTGASLACERETVDRTTWRTERLMLGVRLRDGVPWADLQVCPAGRAKCEARGWIEADPERLRLTPEGRHAASEVIAELL